MRIIAITLLLATPATAQTAFCEEELTGRGIERSSTLGVRLRGTPWLEALGKLDVLRSESAPWNGAVSIDALVGAVGKGFSVKLPVELPEKARGTLEIVSAAKAKEWWCAKAELQARGELVERLVLSAERDDAFSLTLKSGGATATWKTSVLSFERDVLDASFDHEGHTQRRVIALGPSDKAALFSTAKLLGLPVKRVSTLPPLQCPPNTKFLVDPDDELTSTRYEHCVDARCSLDQDGKLSCTDAGPNRRVWLDGTLVPGSDVKTLPIDRQRR